MKANVHNLNAVDHALASSSRTVLFIALTAIIVIMFLLDLMTGSVTIPPGQVARILLGIEIDRLSWEKIIWLFRLPKAIAAVLAGAGLAVGGLLMQNLFRNPLAGSSVLGISSGASLGVALVVLWSASGGAAPRFIQGLGISGKAAMVVSAGLGAGMVLITIMAVARRVRDVMTLLIIGILCGFAVNAGVSVLIHFSRIARRRCGTGGRPSGTDAGASIRSTAQRCNSPSGLTRDRMANSTTRKSAKKLSRLTHEKIK